MNMEMTASGGNLLLPVCVVLPFVGALAVYGIGRWNKRLRDMAANMVALAEFLVLLWLFLTFGKTGRQWFVLPDFGGVGLYLTLDGFRALYGLLASFMWLVTTVFCGEYLRSYHNRNRYYLFTLFTLGGVMGVFLSGELMTTFLFFELMSFSSYVWVVHDETEGAMRAGGTYLAIAVGGGLVMLMGLFLLYTGLGAGAGGHLWTDELMLQVLSRSSYRYLLPAGVCLLIGFGAKAGAFPLHIWLPKAHPVAPAPASALLSGMLTKAGVFGVILISCGMFWHNRIWGTYMLLLGVVTMVLGAVLALFSVNLKRTLACSSLSQIGFILVGIGMCGLLGDENAAAVRGTLLHMVNHSLIKLVLFLAAGVIYQNLHRLELNEIRGFGRNKPLLQMIFLAGALGIGGVPLWNGYVSKTLLHESLVEYGTLLAEGAAAPLLLTAGQMRAIEWIFLVSGGLTVAYMAKLYVCIFVERNVDLEKQKAYDAMKGAYLGRVNGCLLAFCALLLTAAGLLPGVLMNPLADMGQSFFLAEGSAPAVRYFSPGNLKGALISLFVGGVIYLLVVRLWMMRAGAAGREYCNRLSERLDLEMLVYRPLLLRILPFVGGVLCRIADSLVDTLVILLRKTLLRDSALPYELPEGTVITHVTGLVLDHFVYWGRRLRSLGKEEKPVYGRRFEHRLAVLHSSVSEYNTAISRSMSFGLFLFCVGFLLTVVYLLVYYYF